MNDTTNKAFFARYSMVASDIFHPAYGEKFVGTGKYKKPVLSINARFLFCLLCSRYMFVRNEAAKKKQPIPETFYCTDEWLAECMGVDFQTLRKAKAELKMHPELIMILPRGKFKDKRKKGASGQPTRYQITGGTVKNINSNNVISDYQMRKEKEEEERKKKQASEKDEFEWYLYGDANEGLRKFINGDD